MQATSKNTAKPTRPVQLALALLPSNLPGLESPQRSAVVALMAEMLLEAAGWVQEEADDDRI